MDEQTRQRIINGTANKNEKQDAIRARTENMKGKLKETLDETEQRLREQDRNDLDKLTGTDKKTLLTLHTIMLRRIVWMRDNFTDALEKHGKWLEEVHMELEEARAENETLECALEAMTKNWDKQKANTDAKIKRLQIENDNLKKQVANVTTASIEQDHVEELRRENQILQRKSMQLGDRVRKTEASVRRKNLIFSGVTEDAEEKMEETCKKIKDVIHNHLHVIPEIDMVKRLGRSDGKRSRRILVRFTNYWQVEKILSLKNKLRHVKEAIIYIDRDKPPKYPEEHEDNEKSFSSREESHRN